MFRAAEITLRTEIKCSQSEKPMVTDYERKKSFLDDFIKPEESDIDITVKEKLLKKRMKKTEEK